MDPLIKSQQITLIYQAYFDISSVRSGIEPERKLENVETRTGRRATSKRHQGLTTANRYKGAHWHQKADARMRDALAAIERGEGFGDAGDLPLVGVEIGGNRFGGKERSAAAGALGELLKPRFC